ncbi:hypothetical protein [Sunxiuqinia indica]|uniref:hypothetical protein n=1 Tax=Sunxiuqinia indica TaxID=2692584 RepID=UPI00135814D2|nr:hypothetical protein [Sunxiuqinia indica]
MQFKSYKTEDFTLAASPHNTCDGCWFKNNPVANCRGDATKFANSIFSTYSPTGRGSCFKLVAVKRLTTPQQGGIQKPQRTPKAAQSKINL